MISRVVGLHFSPTGSAAKITERITSEISDKINEVCVDDVSSEFFDLLKSPLQTDLFFDDSTIAVIGMPVLNGRIPLPCIKLMQKLHGDNTLAVAVVSYGNSSYGESLYELYTFAEEQGFQIVSAAAFVSQHRFFSKVAAARPDLDDLRDLLRFCELTTNKVKRFCGTTIASLRSRPAPLEITGMTPGIDSIRLTLHPSAGKNCVGCGACAGICPTNAIFISGKEMPVIDAKRCIGCSACVNVCKQGAMCFSGPVLAASRFAFEKLFSRRKSPEWFL